MIKSKSIYIPPHPTDGERLFIDRLWPEGLSTRSAAIARWLQEIAPSYELWRHHYDLSNWDDYRQRYRKELQAADKRRVLDELKQQARASVITLLYGTSDAKRNNAELLKELLECN
ncbi:MAG: DUF488 domain-containing protein [bacterium]